MTEQNQTVELRRDRILAAAQTCSDVDRALRALFPEVFERAIEHLTVSRIEGHTYLYLSADRMRQLLMRSGAVLYINLSYGYMGMQSDEMDAAEQKIGVLSYNHRVRLIAEVEPDEQEEEEVEGSEDSEDNGEEDSDAD